MHPVAIDIDGVLAEWNQPFHKLLTQVGAKMHPLDGEPLTWEWMTGLGATEADIKAACAAYTNLFWRFLPRHADLDRRAMEDLYEINNNHATTFVTARPPKFRDASHEWLQSNAIGTGFNVPETVHVIHTPHRKVMALVALEPRVIIEDNGVTLADYAVAERDHHLPPCLKILVSRPYNVRWQGQHGLVTAINTGDALRTALKHLESL